jgi:hypothetical protein
MPPGIALIRQDNDHLPSENILAKHDRPQGRTSLALFFGKTRKLPPLLTLEFKSCDVPEGFNDSIPMFFTLKGLTIYFKGKHCRPSFSA